MSHLNAHKLTNWFWFILETQTHTSVVIGTEKLMCTILNYIGEATGQNGAHRMKGNNKKESKTHYMCGTHSQILDCIHFIICDSVWFPSGNKRSCSCSPCFFPLFSTHVLTHGVHLYEF